MNSLEVVPSKEKVESVPNPLLAKNVLDYLTALEDPRWEKILDFHRTYESLMANAKGSETKHQAWPGGYKSL